MIDVVRLFEEEVERSSHLNQLLGLGIGLFQGLSNIALNGKSVCLSICLSVHLSACLSAALWLSLTV